MLKVSEPDLSCNGLFHYICSPYSKNYPISIHAEGSKPNFILPLISSIPYVYKCLENPGSREKQSPARHEVTFLKSYSEELLRRLAHYTSM